MRLIFTILIFMFSNFKVFSQLEITTGYAVNKNLAEGVPIQFGYDIKLKNRFYTKLQIGYKHLYHFNDFVGATLKVNMVEYHQTVSYEIIKNKNFILKPNIGINYRFYKWRGEMKMPYNTFPQRVFIVDFRDYRLRLNSFSSTTPSDGKFKDDYKTR